ncbi:MAG: BCCT family transporter [Gammaproteobacteria bacterium]|nr:BCCT family transporter [Gammaproteobacteria bacterium]NIR85731.1 BCCT family transporter [Gammaproteobacteria bacterium]NIR90264.1 BCCT family transporter [Gammaproteobacteria bacterium]NIU06865.1 BCCT family transporter [Gammaproteobacteria bacterium]NIV53798.1 BCCT family transporter [Gammaproteobacteria bacterium]
MFKSPLLLIALAMTGAVAVWGIVDTPGLAAFASTTVRFMFRSRGWFVMLSVSVLLIAAIWLVFSRYAHVKLGKDDDEPEFSRVSWLTMLFAAGMGVGLLYWASAEPVTHYLIIRDYIDEHRSAAAALFVTNFHWGLHAWAIYALTALVIAYFGFRRGCASLISAPLQHTFGTNGVTRFVGGLSDLLAIYAIAIGLGGSVAMGVFQVQGGVESMLGLEASGLGPALAIFAVLCASCALPLMVDLSQGMARLSNTAMATAAALMVFVLLVGPTHFLMSGIVEAIGDYVAGVVPQGFQTYTFMDERVEDWFGSWTLTYMVWWLAWAPFVGVFIARISKGRTIREFLIGVMVVPTVFSVLWFGVFGGIGFYAVLRTDLPMVEIVENSVSATTFFVLKHLPLPLLTSAATIIAAFLFIVTSVVSAAYVLSMFSTGGDLDPPVRVKLIWGAILGALGLAMILSGSIDAVKSIIALGAMPFVFIVLLLLVCLLRALKAEAR